MEIEEGIPRVSIEAPLTLVPTWLGYQVAYCETGFDLFTDLDRASAPTDKTDEYFLMLYEDQIRECKALLSRHYDHCKFCGTALPILPRRVYEIRKVAKFTAAAFARKALGRKSGSWSILAGRDR